MSEILSNLLSFINFENDFDYNRVLDFLKALINKVMELFENL